jgi:hypothetical protein
VRYYPQAIVSDTRQSNLAGNNYSGTFPALIFCHLPTSFTLVFRDMLSCDTMIPGKNIHTLFTIDASIADHFGPGAIARSARARRHMAIQARRRRCWNGICTWADGWDGLWVAV